MPVAIGCLGVAFAIFGGCVLGIFGSQGVAGDELVFAVGALLIFVFGIWVVYKAVTMRPTLPADDHGKSDVDPPG